MSLTPKSRLAQAGLSLAVIAAAAGITLGVTTLLGVTFQGSGEAQQQLLGSQRKEGLLTTANRDRLAICVEAVGVDSSLEAKAKSRIEDALAEIRKDPGWETAGLGSASPIVDIDCPCPPAVLRPAVKTKRTGSGVRASPFPCVEEASYYAEFVFILSRDDLDRIFGSDPEFTFADQEAFCRGDVIAGVTGGMYVTAADLDDPDLLERLKRAVGLWYPERW
jgi:hypothetical protein